jgi:ubiquitin-like modifier-activating enzyme ATG7
LSTFLDFLISIRLITFVDNGKVSYSNPVRQSLFNFSDSENKVPKAEAAALALSLISPNVTSNGVKLSIPMPGHHIDLETATESVADLEKLITEHDVVYLLMDTRESRWLPTVIGKSQNKVRIRLFVDQVPKSNNK